MSKSRCQNLRKIKLKLAETFTEKQPCTNHPLLCELCPRGASAIWKYNLRSHILAKHASANPNIYEPSYRLHPEEKTRMKAVYLTRKRVRASGKSTGPTLLVSDVHSSRLALRQSFILIRLAFLRTDHFIIYRSLVEEGDSDGDTNLTADINEGQGPDVEISSSSEEDLHEKSSESSDGEKVDFVPIEEVPEPNEAGKSGLYLILICGSHFRIQKHKQKVGALAESEKQLRLWWI